MTSLVTIVSNKYENVEKLNIDFFHKTSLLVTSHCLLKDINELLKSFEKVIGVIYSLFKSCIYSVLLLKLEMKMKIAEGKFHEEKLKLQQKHDADVQKVGSVCTFFQKQCIKQ